MSKFTINRILTYFFRGLLFVVPFALTVYVIFQSLDWVDGLIPIDIPGLGLVVILSAVTLLGYLASFFITRPFFEFFERYFIKIPLVNIIYTSLKDLIGAFVGDQKKFNRPVLVKVDESGILLKVGFITNDSLEKLGMEGYISVYMPHSYAWSGNQFLVKQEYITPLKMSSTAAMKFVVSGGVSGLEDLK
ncbi:DUF502 domain-containing protein [Fulvivirga lutea]|uniref:DUF502 domain-containing protein n=1 Tax=Fulvivirga lutea TaxID=2810512 RepID=A0A974WJE0_9BACT|nr:DUF502 domain-containing protein [Fulvivirga lutea]QSE99034.1 DUF502 domain-containing protein [Fulvivirga lutea]